MCEKIAAKIILPYRVSFCTAARLKSQDKQAHRSIAVIESENKVGN